MLDAVEVEGAELGPSGSHNEGIGAFGGGVRRIAIANRSIEANLRFRNRDGIIGTDVSTFRDKRLGEANRRRAGNGVGVGFEGESEDSDFFVFDGIESERYFF